MTSLSRRDFVRKGSLWMLGAVIVGPEFLEHLTWRRTMWPGANLYNWENFSLGFTIDIETMVDNNYIIGLDDKSGKILSSQDLILDFIHADTDAQIASSSIRVRKL